jgi:hypothetical protein
MMREWKMQKCEDPKKCQKSQKIRAISITAAVPHSVAMSFYLLLTILNNRL